MIKLDNTEVFNFEGALRGMRNPLNSWDKSDSKHCDDIDSECDYCGYNKDGALPCRFGRTLIIGPKDMELAKKLVKAGSDHRKFLRQIMVSVDILAPVYWWKEADTYKVGTVANSCSTMHKIHDKAFTLDDFSHEHLLDDDNGEELILYNGEYLNTAIDVIEWTIDALNHFRDLYLKTNDKKYWWQMIQLLPSSYNQMRTVTLNYEVLYNIYHSRKNHKLDEWSIGFINWIESLPYATELIIGE